MAIIRTHKRDNPFVQLDKTFIGGDQLSLKATGLLTYILSKPDSWQIYMKDIQNQFKDGETSIRGAMKELIEAGYVHRWRERDENGRLASYVYEVYERPEFNDKFNGEPTKKPAKKQGKKTTKHKNKTPKSVENKDILPKRGYPDLDKPELDKPELDNQALSNNELSNNELSNNELSNNLSIKEAEIQKLDVPLEVQKQLVQNKKRLIDDNISISDIVVIYKAYKDKVTSSEFALILGNVLTSTKDKINSIKYIMMTSILNHIKQNAAPEPEKKQSNEIVPDWFDDRERGY